MGSDGRTWDAWESRTLSYNERKMILFGALALLCLIAGFGFGMYEHDLRWQIVNAVHSARPDLKPFALFARSRSLHRSEALELYRTHFPSGPLLKKRRMALFAAPTCFLLGAIFLMLAFTLS